MGTKMANKVVEEKAGKYGWGHEEEGTLEGWSF